MENTKKNKKRLVRMEFYGGTGSSWHCKETTEFFNFLGQFSSGIGRKRLKAAVTSRINLRDEKDGHLFILYAIDKEASASETKRACEAWNAAQHANTRAEFFAGRSIKLHLLDWDVIEPGNGGNT